MRPTHQSVCILVAQLYQILCNPTNCSPPGSSVHGILWHEHWSGEPFPSPGHINLGDPQEQSCQTVESVTVSHLLVGLDIAQFPGSMNSNFSPCLELGAS